MTAVEPSRISHKMTFVEDFRVQCDGKYLRGPLAGERCVMQAVWYVEFHATGRCTHPCFDGGNICQLVCTDHMHAFEAKAAAVVEEMRPRWWRKDRESKCPTCGMTIQLTSDVLQVVRGL